MEETLFDTSPGWHGDHIVKPISAFTASNWIPRYHYSGSVGNGAGQFYGVYSNDLWLVVAVGQTTNIHGLSSMLGLERWRGNWEITRVARHPDSRQYPVTAGLARVLARVHKDLGLEWVFSYADSGQDHHGGIYQALNATYVGKNLGGKPPPEWEIFRNGEWEPIHARNLGAMCGTGRIGAIDRLAAKGVQVRIVGERSDKHTYILPIGPPAIRYKIRRALKSRAKPYPKPADGVGETTPASQRDVAVRCRPSALSEAA